MSEELEQSISSGNVFEDLGLLESDELMAKAELVAQIGSIIQHRHLTQAAAAQLLGISQPRVSDLLRGRLNKFSLVMLLQFLVKLDRDVEIVVAKETPVPPPSAPERGCMSCGALLSGEVRSPSRVS